MSAIPRVIAFTAAVEEQRSVLDATRVLAGKPEFTVCNHYADASEQFFAGIWAATRGRWTVRYTEHEFCHLLAGRVVLTNETGERMEFTRGDSFVVPAGFTGTWEVLEECRKLYAIFEPRRAP
jgi:uncharacterized cupin superfamily protein